MTGEATYHPEIEHFTLGKDSASLTAYAIRDETDQIVERGVVSLWPCWDDRRGVCIARGHIMAYNSAGELGQSFRVEGERPRGAWDSRVEIMSILQARCRWHWSLRNEEAIRHPAQPSTQAEQEPAQEPA